MFLRLPMLAAALAVVMAEQDSPEQPNPTGAGVQSAAQNAGATPPAIAQKPTVGRTVIVRTPHHPDAPAIVTAVNADGSLEVNFFRGDHTLHAGHKLTQLTGVEAVRTEAAAEDTALGWFWPPRS